MCVGLVLAMCSGIVPALAYFTFYVNRWPWEFCRSVRAKNLKAAVLAQVAILAHPLPWEERLPLSTLFFELANLLLLTFLDSLIYCCLKY